ncbi:uncharacterized protein LOC124487556 isoform X3 [Hypomesus transpacificus]|uniref:uncharacterized protein LOC124487556 isoform X3 n=1 Tax=Hypomesus transpacificus TaxID=137520 RepID=UPI001F07A72F|nr:uncharacterized protein LOC124487556 isoform X3 [Hypomesus transpacificus]
MAIFIKTSPRCIALKKQKICRFSNKLQMCKFNLVIREVLQYKPTVIVPLHCPTCNGKSCKGILLPQVMQVDSGIFENSGVLFQAAKRQLTKTGVRPVVLGRCDLIRWDSITRNCDCSSSPAWPFRPHSSVLPEEAPAKGKRGSVTVLRCAAVRGHASRSRPRAPAAIWHEERICRLAGRLRSCDCC